ncbi:MAG TPA: prolipoprotein diacylglyceryl transferase [Candidatus Omnitrophota bacterium]|nr:prolipoprotein diacylglyceryl transferase [Candidatus Omnitrophota bacterium]
MHRIIFSLGPVTVYAYGAMLAVAFIAGALLACRRAHARGIDQNRIVDLVFVVMISSLVGARLLFVLLNWQYYRQAWPDIFKLWEGGLVFYGGLIAAVIAARVYLRNKQLPAGKILDIMSPSLGLGIFFGRLGCFLNGCCYGRISSAWGVSFPATDNPPVFAQQVMDGLISGSAACSLPVIPTQLYDAGAGLILCLVLLAIDRKRRFDGFLFGMLVLLYAAARFITESLRYYEPGAHVAGFTVSQWVSIGLGVWAGIFLLRGLKRHGDSTVKEHRS